MSENPSPLRSYESRILNHAEQVDAHFVVVGDERAVERGVEVGRTALKDIGRIGECDGVAQRLLGDDVDHTADGSPRTTPSRLRGSPRPARSWRRAAVQGRRPMPAN